MERDPQVMANLGKQEQQMYKAELFDHYREVLSPIETPEAAIQKFVAEQKKNSHGDIIIKKERLKEKNFIRFEDFEDNLKEKTDLGFCRVKTEAIISTVSMVFTDWSKEYSMREGRLEGIAQGLIDTTDPKKLKSLAQKIFHLPYTLFPIRLDLFHGPNGPIFIVIDGTHRVAACKLAQTESVLAQVTELKEPNEISTTESYRANDWKKMIERGLIEGSVDEHEGRYYLDMNRQVIPWCHRERNNFLKMNITYKNVYPEAFEQVQTYAGEHVPKEVFLDKTGVALNYFLYRPTELGAYIEKMNQK